MDVYTTFEQHSETIKQKRADMESVLESSSRNAKRMDLRSRFGYVSGGTDDEDPNIDRGAGGPILPKSP